MTARQKLLAKVKALLAMTVERGCTEAEALSALTKARALMDEHDITDTDLTFGGETCAVNTQTKDDRYDVRARLATAVGVFCGCKGFKNGIERIAYVGLYSDTVFAHWLLDTLDSFINRECETWLTNNPKRQRVRRLETRGFLWACADRVAQRLYELAPQRQTTDLMVQKNALIDAAMAQAGLRLHERFTLRKVDPAAVHAGRDAGDRATFDKPLQDGEGPTLLGDH